MNIEFIDNLIIPIIVAGCFCIGYIVKKWLPTDDKWIPTIVGIVGGLLGFIITDKSTPLMIMTGVIAGVVSGLASTGVHQMFKQHLHIDEPHEMTEAEALEWIENDEEVLDDLEEV